MKTIKVIPFDIGAVHLVLTLEVSAPASILPATPGNQGKRLPQAIRDDIEKRLLAGEKPPKIASAVGVSTQIVYIMRSRMRTEGLVGEPAFNRMAGGRKKGLLDYDYPTAAHAGVEVETGGPAGDDEGEDDPL